MLDFELCSLFLVLGLAERRKTKDLKPKTKNKIESKTA